MYHRETNSIHFQIHNSMGCTTMQLKCSRAAKNEMKYVLESEKSLRRLSLSRMRNAPLSLAACSRIFSASIRFILPKYHLHCTHQYTAEYHLQCTHQYTAGKGKGKGAIPQWDLGEVLISQTSAIEPVGGWTTESVMHGQCDARPTVTFPAAERHRPLAGTKLYCLVT